MSELEELRAKVAVLQAEVLELQIGTRIVHEGPELTEVNLRGGYIELDKEARHHHEQLTKNRSPYEVSRDIAEARGLIPPRPGY